MSVTETEKSIEFRKSGSGENDAPKTAVFDVNHGRGPKEIKLHNK